MIKNFDYLKTFYEIEEDIKRAISETLASGQLSLGPQTASFEKEFSAFIGARHCVAVSSGTTALQLALRSLDIGPGDEVITTANTCVPTVASIRLAGAVPGFIDVRSDSLTMDIEQLENNINSRTKCIMPVHLWGQSEEMNSLLEFTRQNGLFVVEDCSQAHGTLYHGKHVGIFGDIGCFSFYPTKNLGAYGEGGAVVTNNENLAQRIRSLRMYGYDENQIAIEEGMNGRISEIQAAILRVKLNKLPEWLDKRRENANVYDMEINHEDVILPFRNEHSRHSYHQYVIRTTHRNELIEILNKNNIGYGIHYPVPVHQMPAYKELGDKIISLPVSEKASKEILSLPVHEALTTDEIKFVAGTINKL